MKNCLSKICLLFVLFVILTASVRAWDDTGHKLSAYIAWERVSPQAREQITKILLSAPEDSDLSVFYLQDSRSNAARQRELFMIASTWADIVRERKFKNRFEKYHKGDWHYADTFWRQTNGKVEILENFGESKGKAVDELVEFDKLMRDAAAPDSDKAIALAWFLHLAGDIHQPLHTSARVTEFEPKGDQGGNLFELTAKDAPREDRVNLHWYWDSIIGRNVPRVNDACDSDYLPAIAQTVTKNYPFSKMQNRLKIGKFKEWQAESFEIATKELFPATLVRYQMPTETYKKRAFEIAQEQIALAGYRMSETLNQIFGSQDLTREQYDKGKDKYENDAKQTGAKIGQGVNDLWLWTKIRTALASTADLRESTINVDVEEAVVTLRGTVSTKEQKETALRVAKNIDGVVRIINNLKISPSK
jgi:osmotically-inducible protein OsmY